ncbi:MAG TPA: hypothetical protein VFE59_26205 [Trebonia sp.]|nr:hypothetical protein [Trebonia sp.]
MPPRGGRAASREQLTAWAQQGLDRLGAEAVHSRAERTHFLAKQSAFGTAAPEDTAELRGMWASDRQLQNATDAAFGLRSHMAAELLGVPEEHLGFSSHPAAAATAADVDPYLARHWGAEATAAEAPAPEIEMEAAL